MHLELRYSQLADTDVISKPTDSLVSADLRIVSGGIILQTKILIQRATSHMELIVISAIVNLKAFSCFPVWSVNQLIAASVCTTKAYYLSRHGD